VVFGIATRVYVMWGTQLRCGRVEDGLRSASARVGARSSP